MPLEKVDPSDILSEDSSFEKVDPSQIVSEESEFEKVDPSQIVSEEGVPTPKQALTTEYKRQQQTPLTQLAGEFISGVPSGLGTMVTETLPKVVKGTAQLLSPTSPTSYWDRTKLLGSALAENTKGILETAPRNTARLLANLAGRVNPDLKYSDAGLEQAAGKSITAQDEAAARQTELAAKGFTPEQIEAAGFVADPLNIATMGVAGAGRKVVGEVVESALKGGAKTSLPRRMLAAGAETLGNVTEKIGTGIEKVKGAVPAGVAETAELGQKAGLSVRSIIGGGSIGYLLGGPTGAALLGSASQIPTVIENISQIAKVSGRLLRKGRTYEGFFDGLANAPEITSPSVKLVAKFMDKSGLGNLIEDSASAGLEGTKVAALFAPLNIVLADTPEQAGEMTGNALGLAGLTHLGIDTLNPGNRKLASLKQANEVANYVQKLKQQQPEAVAWWEKRFQQDPRAAAGELNVIAAFKNADPNGRVIFTSTPQEKLGAQNSFDPRSGDIILDLNSSFKDNVGRIMGHESVHKWMAAGLRAPLMNELLGNPELKSAGVLGSWDATGQFIPSKEFLTYKENYSKGLSPEQKLAYDSGSPFESAGRYAEEYLAELIGSRLAGTTKSGEVVFNKLRRNSVVDNLFEKFGGFLGETIVDKLQPRWGGEQVLRQPHTRYFKELFDNYVKMREMSKPNEKGFEYSSSFGERAMTDEQMAKNPTEAAKLNKASNEFQFSIDKDGKEVFKRIRTQRAAEKFAQAQAAAVVEIMRHLKPEKPSDLQLRTRADGSEEWSGTTMSDNLANALAKSGVFNPGQIKNLQTVITGFGNPGSWIRMFYQPATKGKGKGRKAAARPGAYYDTIPLDLVVSQPKGKGKGSNVLVRALDVSQLEKNYIYAIEKRGEGAPETITSFDDVLGLFKIMAENHRRGYGATGEPLSGFQQVGESVGTMSLKERDFVNELMGASTKDTKAANPMNAALESQGIEGSKSVIKTFRLDRINDLTPLTERAAIPAEYSKIKQNLSPSEKRFSSSEDTTKLNGWMGTSGKITAKGSKFHDELAYEITGKADKVAASNDLFSKNFLRTRVEVGTLFLENQSGKMPTAKQLKEAKDLAIEHGLRGITFDGPQGPKRLWSASENADRSMYSPASKNRVANEETRKVADEYMKVSKIPYKPYTEYRPVDESYIKNVADTFDKLQSNPNDPEVKRAYTALGSEVKAQWDAMTGPGGIKVELWDKKGQPYKDSTEMKNDVEKNKHMYVFPTEQGYGTNQSVSTQHPLLSSTGVEINGKPLLLNDMFRAVHDYFGHTKEGYEFGPRGEYNAYLAHKSMFTKEAVPALAAETLAQNAWVNFGKHNRDDKGNILKPGDKGFISVLDRPYAEQKAVVMPDKLLSPSDETLFRGGGEGSMPRGLTAKDIVDYETTELGNEIRVEKGVDLSSIPSEGLKWLTMTKREAREYGKAEKVPLSKYQVVARDGQGGVLVNTSFSPAEKTDTSEIHPRAYRNLSRGLPKHKEGFTFDLSKGEFVEKTEEYIVSEYPDRTFFSESQPTKQQLKEFTQKNKDLLRNPEHLVGGWLDTDTNKWNIDVVTRIKDRSEAVSRGVAANQKSIAYLGKKEVEIIPTGGTEESKSPDSKLFSPTETPTFYSKVKSTVDELPRRFTVGQLRAALSPEKGVKPEELQWMNFEAMLEGKKPEDKITKEEAQKWAQESEVQIKEVVKGEPREGAYKTVVNEEETQYDGRTIVDVIDPSNGITRFTGLPSEANNWISEQGMMSDPKVSQTEFSQYQLPGGENYRELLITLPARGVLRYTKENILPLNESDESHGAASRRDLFWYFKSPDNVFQIPKSKFPTEASAIDYILKDKQPKPSSKDTFKSSHFKEPNVLAHVRFNERTDADGKKILFIEEVQSDWHQKGRKEGYKGNADTTGWTAKEGKGDPASGPVWEVRDANRRWILGVPRSTAKTAKEAILRAADSKRGPDGNRVPDAPFKKNWHELTMKRMLDWAVKNGFDKVAWTTGEQQAARYDLSKQINRVEYEPVKDKPGHYEMSIFDKEGKGVFYEDEASLKRIEEVVGKDLAKKIESGEGEKKPDSPYREWKILSGLDLKVGGEGMKGFYDKILPAFMDKYGKKFGTKVETTQVGSPGKLKVVNIVKDEYDVMAMDGSILDTFKSRKEANEFAAKQYKDTVHSVAITPQLKETILGKGQALFSPSKKFDTEGTTQLVPKKEVEHGQNGTFSLIHYSNKSDLKELNPKYAGTGIDRQKNDPGLPKVFYFKQGSSLGQDAGLVGKNRYTVKVSGKGIYDLSGDDPLGFWQNPNREMQEDMLKRAGYSGVSIKTGGRDVVALFYPTQTQIKSGGKLYSSAEGLKVRGEVKEAIEKYLLPEETTETIYGRASESDKTLLGRVADRAERLFFKGLDSEQRKRARQNKEVIAEPF